MLDICDVRLGPTSVLAVKYRYLPLASNTGDAASDMPSDSWCGFALAAWIVGLSYLARRESPGLEAGLRYWPVLLLAAPIVLDLALFSDFAQRAGMKGIQEWLSFYYKSPMAAPGLQPEHDLFIQQTKLKNTLRHLMGEDQITHLGLEYYA